MLERRPGFGVDTFKLISDNKTPYGIIGSAPRKLRRREDRTRGKLGLRRRQKLSVYYYVIITSPFCNLDQITTTGFPPKKLYIPVTSASFVSLPRFRRSIIVKFRESVEIRPGTDSMQTRRIPYWISDLDPTVSLLDHRCHRLKSALISRATQLMLL